MAKRGVTLVVAGVLVAGCFSAPELDEPNLVWPDTPLTEVFRIPAPVPAPPPDRQVWRVYDWRAGLLGEGRRIAEVDLRTGRVRWALDLPEEYALTAAAGPHSGFSVGAGAVLLAGSPGVVGVTAVRLVGADRPVWERRLPVGGQVTRSGEELLAAGPVWLDNYFGTTGPADVHPGERVLAQDFSWVDGVGYLDRSSAVPSTGPRPPVPPGP